MSSLRRVAPFAVLSWIVSCLLPVTSPARDGSGADAFAAGDAAALQFFEKQIRPVLVRECYQCHSQQADKRQGGLSLDSRDGLLTGGDSGPAVVVGRPHDSLLIEAIRHESFEMPPEKRLPERVIADFEYWIRSGMIDPREAAEGARNEPRVLYAPQDAASHWAFQPITKPAVPAIDDAWIQSPIDAFILADLRAAGLEPSPPADPRTLLRRVSYDLLGLPPSLEEVRAFEADPASDAFPQRVDRLLQSPRYGERWARHWLDVARYSDTNGQRPAPTPDPPFYPFAWLYRDYVIDALNRDLPFDRFIVEQLAGDALATEEDRRPLAALGFLRVGKSFGQNVDDRIDDRIDALTKGFLGLTVACARCHDHKLDPVYQEDYYALHGVLSSTEDIDVLYHDTAGTPEYEDYLRRRERLVGEIEAECLAGLNQFMHGLTLQVADFLVGAEKYRDGQLGDKHPSLAAREVGLLPIPFKAWLAALERWQQQNTPAYRPWFAFAALSDDTFADKASQLATQVATGSLAGTPIPAIVARKFQDQTPLRLRDVADIYQSIFLEIEHQAAGQYPMAAILCAIEESPGIFRPEYLRHPALPPPLPDPDLEAVRQLTIGFEGPFSMTPRELMQSGASGPRKAMVRRKHEVAQLEAEHPGAPIRVMALCDRDDPVDSPVFIRGDRGLPGTIVPRRFLQRLSAGEPKPFTRGSGRFELAQAIASPDNPLTARVIVNRVWQWHFGTGLVATPSDFGLNAEPPTHPELLDWLANWFIEEGWSLRKLHRLIINSSVYQQSSLPRIDAMQVDSENQLYWRMAPRRMSLEEIRDTFLQAGGTLEQRVGGRPVDPLADTTRRSVYLHIDRYQLPDLFSTFDFAPPDMTTAQRDRSIVPQQSLWLMNSQWVMDRGSDLACRAEVSQAGTSRDQIRELYAILYQRGPDRFELAAGLRFLQGWHRTERAEGLQRLAHALLQTVEAVYVQ